MFYRKKYYHGFPSDYRLAAAVPTHFAVWIDTPPILMGILRNTNAHAGRVIGHFLYYRQFEGKVVPYFAFEVKICRVKIYAVILSC